MTVRVAPKLDVLVIGAGQAGLAAGYHLRSRSLRFEIVDRADHVGDSWRARYDSLTLFTPRSYSALPGLSLAGDPEGFAGKDEIADYLERYATAFVLPTRLGRGVRQLERCPAGFCATLDDGTAIETATVVVAAGAFQQAAVPAAAAGFAADVQQLSAAAYRRPGDVEGRTVLVVGDGASGRHIARELAATRSVLLALGKPRRLMPDRVLGRSTFWWLDHLGLLSSDSEGRIGRRLRDGDAFPARGLYTKHLVSAGVTPVPRLVESAREIARFADGQQRAVDAVVWATGYRDDSAWVKVDGALGPDGSFVQSRGVSPVAGLYFVGRPWQRSRGSGLLCGVGADARAIVDLIGMERGTSARQVH